MAYGKDTKLRSQIMLVKDKVIIITGGAKGIGITLSHKSLRPELKLSSPNAMKSPGTK